MRWSYNKERSRAVAAWLFLLAGLVVAMVVVGGATRLTGSGLSITSWKPIRGVVPPLSVADWRAEFAAYQRIPQYRLVNAGMTLDQFKGIFWWEWSHRLLGRITGLVAFAPFFVFLALRRLPRRLIAPCAGILALGALQGLVGWWMVASGLQDRVAVAPERLAIHLGVALVLFCACLWVGLDAWWGRGRASVFAAGRWRWAPPALFALAFFQCLLGALVAGSRAGLIDGDWPRMGGRWFPEDYVAPGSGLLGSWLHSQPAVQFDHRMGGYLLFLAALAFAVVTRRDRLTPAPVRKLGHALAGAVFLQMLLGIGTLLMGDPIWMGAIHQLGAVGVLGTALALAWQAPRA
ncbi:MAG: COX15/CtaA family protein [Caulobacteraceae bacterium]|nr:COX15/CtaA family protein [Caulobacter sp.]